MSIKNTETGSPVGLETPNVTLLPAAKIMAKQPQTLLEAQALLGFVLNRPFYAANRPKNRDALWAYLSHYGMPDPKTYGLFAIRSHGSHRDIELK